jgi:hypothetical protein
MRAVERKAMSIRLLINDKLLCEGEGIPIPRVGDHLRRDDDAFPVEAVTWDLSDAANVVVVSILVGTQPYTH